MLPCNCKYDIIITIFCHGKYNRSKCKVFKELPKKKQNTIFSSKVNWSSLLKPVLKILYKTAGMLSDDIFYRMEFENTIKNFIYRKHVDASFMCCVFCIYLFRSPCHRFCFSCAKKTYNGCNQLLPGAFSFTDSYFGLTENELKPWAFKVPCKFFERLELRDYLRNFISLDNSATTANYEVLEGIFTGLSRGKRPCHICACVNKQIYNNCFRNAHTLNDTPCENIYNKISAEYRSDSWIAKNKA